MHDPTVDDCPAEEASSLTVNISQLCFQPPKCLFLFSVIVNCIPIQPNYTDEESNTIYQSSLDIFHHQVLLSLSF